MTRYDDGVWLTRHPALCSSAVCLGGSQAAAHRAAADLQDVVSHMGMRRERPTHTAMRQGVHAACTPRVVERWRPLVRSVIHTRLDEAEAQGGREVRHACATPMTVAVIAQMVGVPQRERDVLQAWSEALLTLSRWRRAPGERHRLPAVLQGLRASLAPLVEARRTQPTDDLLSMLVQAEQDGACTRQEVMAHVVLLLAAGHEPTSHLLGNGLLACLRHPEPWALCTHAPRQYAVLATEACRRDAPPVKSFPRIAVAEGPWRGKVRRPGERVRWVRASANHDPAQWVAPDRFDRRREPHPHGGLWGGPAPLPWGILGTSGGTRGLHGLGTTVPDAPRDD